MNIWTRNCGTFYYDICSDLECEIYSVMPDSLRPHGLYSPWNSPGQNIGMGSLSLLQGIVPIQGSNPCLPHCRWILYQLSHKGSPRIPECVAYPFSSRSSQPRNQIGISCIAGRFFTNWAIRESHVRRPIKVPLVMLKRWLLESTKDWGLVASSQACD